MALNKGAHEEGGGSRAAATGARWGVWGGARDIACAVPTFPPSLISWREDRAAVPERRDFPGNSDFPFRNGTNDG